MGKDVRVSLEAFGNKRLSATLTPEEIKGKNVGEIVNYIISKNWQGEDRQTLEMIKREVMSSGGYTPSVEVGDRNLPVKAQPVRLGDPIERYVQDPGLTEDELVLSVTGDHIVGYKE